MKQGKIYLYDQYVGLLTEDETGFTFAYDADYLASDGAEAVSLTLPLSDEPYHDTVLFPFFDGLIPEGWLLNIAESSWKINQRDRMSLRCNPCLLQGLHRSRQRHPRRRTSCRRNEQFRCRRNKRFTSKLERKKKYGEMSILL